MNNFLYFTCGFIIGAYIDQNYRLMNIGKLLDTCYNTIENHKRADE